MKKTKIFYWVFNVLFALLMFMSAIPDVLSNPDAVKGMHEILGYPLYLLPFIGVAKVLGAITILIPGFTRLKEWAYAGLVFDLMGATYSIAHVPNPEAPWFVMFVPLALAFAAYYFYRKREQEEKLIK